MGDENPPPAPKPVVAEHEKHARRDGEPAWMPTSGRPGYEFPREHLPREARITLARIARGGSIPYPRDGSIHHNLARDLPDKHRYREFTVTGTGQPRSGKHGFGDRGRRRLVIADDGSVYYTAAHYDRAPRQKLTRTQKEVLRDRMPPEWQNAMYRVRVHPVLQRRLRDRMAERDRKEGLAPVRQPHAAAAKRPTKGLAMPSSKTPPLTPTFNRHASGNPPPQTTRPQPVHKPESAPPSPGPTINGSAPIASPNRTSNVKPPQKNQSLTQNFNRQSRGIKP